MPAKGGTDKKKAKKEKKEKADSEKEESSDEDDYGDEDAAVAGTAGTADTNRPNGSLDSFHVQLAAGAAFGGAAGYLDNTYSEPFGLIIGGSLLMMQLLDHEGLCSFFWNTRAKAAAKEEARKPHQQGLVEELKHFCCANAFVAGGFTAGYLVGYKVVDMS